MRGIVRHLFLELELQWVPKEMRHLEGSNFRDTEGYNPLPFKTVYVGIVMQQDA
jgi:hypothetical protein